VIKLPKKKILMAYVSNSLMLQNPKKPKKIRNLFKKYKSNQISTGKYKYISENSEKFNKLIGHMIKFLFSDFGGLCRQFFCFINTKKNPKNIRKILKSQCLGGLVLARLCGKGVGKGDGEPPDPFHFSYKPRSSSVHCLV
jgi:hypothetical protein